MTEIATVDWGDKYAAEQYVNGLDWTDFLQDDVLDDQTISTVAATVIDGDITIDDPVPTFTSGVYQYVWVSGGTAGVSIIEATVTTSDGWILKQRIKINVVA